VRSNLGSQRPNFRLEFAHMQRFGFHTTYLPPTIKSRHLLGSILGSVLRHIKLRMVYCNWPCLGLYRKWKQAFYFGKRPYNFIPILYHTDNSPLLPESRAFWCSLEESLAQKVHGINFLGRPRLVGRSCFSSPLYKSLLRYDNGERVC
jgi:hypothetical protein